MHSALGAYVSDPETLTTGFSPCPRSLGHVGCKGIGFWAKEGCKEMWGVLGGSRRIRALSVAVCRAQGSAGTQNHTERTRKGSRASRVGKATWAEGG